ncbi:MAG: antitoxin family protein [Chloroflexota bacterium]
MNTTISAVYEQGALRLFTPLKLPESTNVQVQVLSKNAYKQRAFHRRLATIHDVLSQVEQEWSNNAVRHMFPQILRTDLKMLWHLCKPPQRELCTMLELSAIHLNSEDLTHEQVSAFRSGIGLLESDKIQSNDFDACYDRLIDVGLPPSFSYDDAVVESYLDEF